MLTLYPSESRPREGLRAYPFERVLAIFDRDYRVECSSFELGSVPAGVPTSCLSVRTLAWHRISRIDALLKGLLNCECASSVIEIYNTSGILTSLAHRLLHRWWWITRTSIPRRSHRRRTIPRIHRHTRRRRWHPHPRLHPRGRHTHGHPHRRWRRHTSHTHRRHRSLLGCKPRRRRRRCQRPGKLPCLVRLWVPRHPSRCTTKAHRCRGRPGRHGECIVLARLSGEETFRCSTVSFALAILFEGVLDGDGLVHEELAVHGFDGGI